MLDTEKGRAFCIKIDVFKKKMWFAYVDSSMAWYDFDIELVKKLIAANKKGEKAPPLEDLKQTSEVSRPSVDLIQENSVDRFEKKNRSFNKNKPQGQNPNQNKFNNNSNGPKKARVENSNRPERVERTDKPENTQPKPRQQKPAQPKAQAQVQAEKNIVNPDTENKPQGPPKKKFKKKFPPKKDNNA